MNRSSTKSSPLDDALNRLCQTGEQDIVDSGFNDLKAMADAGDMEAAAIVGHASILDHIKHVDFDACRKYLTMSAESGNAKGQYYLGSMLLLGNPPFEQDAVYGKWLLEQSAAGGDGDAKHLLKVKYEEPDMEAIRKMFQKATLSILLDDFWNVIKAPFVALYRLFKGDFEH